MQVIPLWENSLSSIFNYPLKFFLTMGISSRSTNGSKFDLVLNNLLFRRGYGQSEDEEAESFESPLSLSLVQVPVQFVVGSIKEKLPVMEYYRFGKEDVDGCDSKCAICLKWLGEGDEVRELCNCCHVFHKECLDGWIEQGQLTCPLCSSKLFMSTDQDEGEVIKCGGDPWRRERIIYMFGEDFVFR